jgi:hypothetical protein
LTLQEFKRPRQRIAQFIVQAFELVLAHMLTCPLHKLMTKPSAGALNNLAEHFIRNSPIIVDIVDHAATILNLLWN